MIDLLRLVFEVVSNLFFLPALVPLAQQRRHFALFVGIAQFLAALLYCLCDFLQVPYLFIPAQNWHFISDVLSLTYALLLCIHLCAFEDEERSIVLRYCAFFTSWIFKYRDAWDSVYWEAMLVVVFLLILLHSHATHDGRRKRFKQDRLQRGLVLALASLVFFLGHLKLNDSHKILMGLAHCGAGWACFELWSVLPAPSKAKRMDVSLSGAASFV